MQRNARGATAIGCRGSPTGASGRRTVAAHAAARRNRAYLAPSRPRAVRDHQARPAAAQRPGGLRERHARLSKDVVGLRNLGGDRLPQGVLAATDPRAAAADHRAGRELDEKYERICSSAAAARHFAAPEPSPQWRRLDAGPAPSASPPGPSFLARFVDMIADETRVRIGPRVGSRGRCGRAQYAAAQPSRRGSEPAMRTPLSRTRIASTLHGPSKAPTATTG